MRNIKMSNRVSAVFHLLEVFPDIGIAVACKGVGVLCNPLVDNSESGLTKYEQGVVQWVLTE